MSRKKWVVSSCDKDRASEIAENCGIDPFAAYLLCSRGFTDEFEVESFLYDTDLCDPFSLPDMPAAVSRVTKALNEGERITVFGDYDADGITSSALVYSYLQSCGAAVDYYIPDRAGEGYGLSEKAIDRIAERGTKLILTVDNGISAVSEIAHAAELGVDVVVTDHHRAGSELPQAAAVVDPHREDAACEFSDWAGVGVAFKLVSALSGGDNYDLLSEYGDFVALGTIADIVPLRGENRILVRDGLAFLNQKYAEGRLCPGLTALIDLVGGKKLDCCSAAFRIAPRLNAAGRMGSAERALKLLLTKEKNEAELLAGEINEANSLRQTTESEITLATEKVLWSSPEFRFARVIVVDGENWHPGVIGIVASRLVERYGKPCVVFSRDGAVSKGSGRSVAGFSLYDAFAYCADTLLQFGGHTMAAGLTIETEKLGLFREKINEYARQNEPPFPVLHIDCKLNPASLSLSMLDVLHLLEPFGAENPQPLFGLFGMTLTGIQPVGGGKHLRLTAARKGASVTVMLFSVSPARFPYAVGDTVDLAVRLSENEYQGETKLSVQLRDIKFSAQDDGEVLATLRQYELLRAGETVRPKDALFPDRVVFASVFRFLRNRGSWGFGADVLCLRLGLPDNKTAQCRAALDVLTELGVLLFDGDNYTLPAETTKTELGDSAIYRMLCEGGETDA